MLNLLQNLAQASLNRSAWLAAGVALLVAFAPRALFAEDPYIEFKGQRIYYQNATPAEIEDSKTGEMLPVLIFKGNGWYQPTKTGSCRALVVGGGGAGGYGTTGSTNPGGGGGGGQVVDKEGLPFLAEKYTVTIGAGGAQTTAAGNGEDGQSSSISNETASVVSALGGGGGGSQAAGNGGDTVATGGGGGGNGNLGGVGALGADYQGGKAAANNRSGGGGGAGGAGKPSTSSKGGDGGAGITLNVEIWGPETIGIPSAVGGGGGGGQSKDYTTSDAGQGVDGGGSGGAREEPGHDGTVNTGGGGGGGGRGSSSAKEYCTGGAGASGIVVIRFEDIATDIEWVAINVTAGGNDGKIFVDKNASHKWLPNGDLIIAYSNASIKGGLRFYDPDQPELPPIWAKARILAVGGGGGGGMIDPQSSGGGGGGGAGGFVERSGFVFDNTVEYSITVGAGGQGGKTNEDEGKPGKDSSVTTNGANVIDVAVGGGGGGAHCAGGNGGSGGGGSRSTAGDNAGGTGVSGQGFNGGLGGAGLRGGGGGGAGGPGGDASGSIVGTGGPGRSCNITGVSVMYAGGGGGAYVNATSATSNPGGAGGEGGGGDGAGAASAKNGVDGLGGGGGGAASHSGAGAEGETAGKGGNGVVIIRLSGFVVKNIPVPGKWDSTTGKYWGPTTNVYDGTEHVGVAPFFAYGFVTSKTDRTTWPVAVDADNYVVTVDMAEHSPYTWADWHEGDPEEKKWGKRYIYWRINRRVVEVPKHTTSFVYDATEHIAVDANKLHLDDAGYCYTDDELGLKFCQLTPTHRAVDADFYNFEAQLFTTTDVNGQGVTNFVWDTGKIDNIPYEWRIRQAKNAILKFDYPPRKTTRQLDPLSEAVLVCDWPKRDKMKLGENILVEYRPWGAEGEGGWTAWRGRGTGQGPEEAGSYEVRVTIPKCDNWAGATNSVEFGTWKQLADIFSDQMPVTAAAAGASLANFPVPVRLREPTKDGYSEMSGFTYLRAGLDGTAIQFFDKNEDPIPHEVELWNIRGESVVWVKLPSVTTSATSFKMCWRRVSDIYLKPYDGGAVWRDNYSGVWHMSRLEEGRIPDATGNDRSAYFTGDAQWELIDKAKGAPMANGVYLTKGDLLVDDNPLADGTYSNKMTFSGWYKFPDFKADKSLAYGYKMFAGSKLGATSTAEMKSLNGWALRMNNANNSVVWESSNYEQSRTINFNLQTTMGFLAYKAGYNADGTGVNEIYGNATEYKNGDKNADHRVHGSNRPLQIASAGFYADEVRISTNALSDAWIKEEYYTVNKANYCVNGLVSIDCDKYNNGAGLICDWWTTVPSMSTTMWKQGETAATVGKGTYKGASTAINAIYKNLKTGEVTTNDTQAALGKKPVGYYRATFDHSSPAAYRPQVHSIDFYIIENVKPTNDLGGSESGRILLMNADNKTDGPVTNQSWSATDPGGVTYWERLDATEGVVSNNVLPGTSFELVRSADKKVLWHLKECRQGNTFPTNVTDSATLPKGQNFLPKSTTTALSVTNENVAVTSGKARVNTGWLMLRNVEGASVTSGVFTNGVGTIYFDAVNQKAVGSENYKLVVEVATAETAAELEGPVEGLDWRQVRMIPYWYRSGSAGGGMDGVAVTNDVLALAETQGASESYFYRVHAPVIEHRPTRVRIVRTAFDYDLGEDEAMILLDNLIVSIPPTSASLVPYGMPDAELADLVGVQVVGKGGAFVPPFPSAGASAPKGRAKVVLPAGCAYAGQSPDTYLSLAQMFYRRRYLGQLEGSGEWQVAIMEGAGADAVETLEPLGVAMDPGDVEFKFTAVMKAPYYGYVDYGGKNIGVDKNKKWTEEDPLKESRFKLPTEDTRLASMGEDWFVRVRRAASNWERVNVELHGAIERQMCPMELMDDGTWRAVVRIPVDAKEGAACTFKFVSWNEQTPGATDYASNMSVWGGGGTVEELPNNGVLSPGNSPISFKVDHRSGWIEFRIRLEGESKIWSIARAEYQDFNSWNDAHTTDDLFHVNDVLTNGVDDVNMASKTNDWSKYALFEAENDAWNETFYTADYSKDFPLDVVYDQAPKMPNGYYRGRYVSFVHSKLAKKDDEAKAAGLAGKLLGQGKGTIDFLGSEAVSPDGIDTITFQTRVGQSASFDGIGYDKLSVLDEDYMFFTLATMSQACNTDGATLGDMAVGASISVVANYDAYFGCYEFRVERPFSGPEYTLTLRKWHVVNNSMTCKTLASTRFYANKPVAWTDEASTKGDAAKGYYGLFISCKNIGEDVQIVAGISQEAKKQEAGGTYPARAYSGGAFNGFTYTDKAANNPHVYGGYGVMSKDCPAQFLLPIKFHEPLATLPAKSGDIKDEKGTVVGTYFSKQTVTLNEADDATTFDQCRDAIKSGRRWALPPTMRLEKYNVPGDESWIGLRAPTNLEQTAIVQIRKQGGSDADWTTVMETPVNSYAFVDKKLVLHKTGRWDVRYTTGEQAIDVVFTDIRQTRWHAADDANIDYHNEDFTFTQALLETNTVSRRRELVLQPARADASKPVSLRAPMVNGLGKLTFSYAGADADAQIWVQIATNNVSGSTLGGNTGYNQSIREGEDEGEWITVRKFGPYAAGCDEELGEKGVRTVYVGFHDDGTAEKPHKGVMRLWVPTEVVTRAVDLATNANKRVSYGQVTVTGVQATDEPRLSERSWRGWNMRTAGDAADSERRMHLSDATLAGDIGYGLVGALNNTADPATIVETDDGLKAKACLPTIFSPTFGAEGGGRTGIGAVSFKARVYERPGETAPAGRITVWGASDNTGANWTVIGTNEVVSTVFTNFTWATGGSYSAIKIELSSPGYREGVIDTGRVILDEILISEKVQPSVTFDYARPFRMNLGTHKEIIDIMSANEQPLAGESWGVQTKLTLKQLEKEVDVEKGFRVYLSYYRGEEPWGYEQWKDRGDAVVRQELELVGDASNLVFRSNIESPETLVPPAATGGQTVQFMLEAEYSTGAGKAESQMLTRGMWQPPEWYYPVDKNADHGADRDETKFAAYSIIDTVSPGRAWINEVNWNDGMKSETGGTLSKTNQYIEVCVPAGVDMTGWWVQLTGVSVDEKTEQHTTGKLFTFGKGGVAKSKATGRAVNGYEFMFIQSPLTAHRGDGGVKDRFGKPADGTWSDATQANTDQGTLSYYMPYQFELYRPSGVLEHQFVLEGTNTSSLLSGSMYAGTNLVAQLNEQDVDRHGYASPKRFYAGEERARRKSGVLYGSAGVTGGTATGDPAPGAEGTWNVGLGFTPGELNEGQEIPAGWFLPPNGTNSWIYASVVGDHLHQKIGDETGPMVLMVVPQGGKTNIHYTVDNYYELDAITVNGVTNATPHKAHAYDYEISSPSGTMYIVATEGIDRRLLDDHKLGPKNKYTPSIVNWLGEKWPNRDIDEMQPASFQCVNNDSATKYPLSLTDMYWLDIPPFTESGEPEWLLRAGVTDYSPLAEKERHGIKYTNMLVTVKAYLENDHTHKTNRLVRLQGLDDARSDNPATYAGWKSETFKIRGALDLNQKFMPFRTFVFDGGSFGLPGEANEYTSQIEIRDPFSAASPGHSYGWDLHPDKRNSTFWRISLDSDTQPVSVEMLKADSTY